MGLVVRTTLGQAESAGRQKKNRKELLCDIIEVGQGSYLEFYKELFVANRRQSVGLLHRVCKIPHSLIKVQSGNQIGDEEL